MIEEEKENWEIHNVRGCFGLIAHTVIALLKIVRAYCELHGL